uniref:Uncharacterized protein n=1 Tax=Meloidogyne hapla TaxID=6305 RepID=A0A1I8BIZ8_MELHA
MSERHNEYNIINNECSTSQTIDIKMKNVDGIILPKRNIYRTNIENINEFDYELNNLSKIKDKDKLEDKINLVLLKINICKNICNFHDPNVQIASKEAKRLTLIELLDFFSQNDLKILNNNIWNSENIYLEIFELFSKNVIRDLPPNEDELNYEEDEDFDNYTDPAWEHLELIYNIFIKFIESKDFRITLAKKYLNEEFLEKIFYLFYSEDIREREQLAKISTNSLQLWKEEGRIKYLLKEYNNKITPIIFNSLRFCSKNHWNKEVKKLSEDVQNILAERDWKLWNKLIEENLE